MQIQQPSYSPSAKPTSTIHTPVRSTNVKQASTPSVAAFHERSNKAEIVVEHVGSKTVDKNTNAKKKIPSIQFKSLVKPYKFMYQTMYQRANGLYCREEP